VVLASLVAALVACAHAGAGDHVVRLGAGADEVWIFRPAGAVRSVVVFAHGWSTPFPWQGFAAWIVHLRARGDLVIYPRYRVSANDSSASALAAFEDGIVTAFRQLGPLHVPVVAVGKSFGASAVFDYAAEAHAWGVPAPVAVVSIFPALPINGVLPPLLPPTDYVEIFVGDRDTVVGSAGADAFWHWLARHRPALKRYTIVRSRPGFIAGHDSAQLNNPIAHALFWRPVDNIISTATRTQEPRG
jgi:hypothetical protein